jgi:hypothetical protein
MKIECECYLLGFADYCKDCGGKGFLQIRFTMEIPTYLSLDYVKFEPVAGLFGVFLLEGEVIGVGNIECRTNSLYIYDLQSFKGSYGYALMIKSLRKMENVQFIEGNTTNEEFLFWKGAGARIEKDTFQWTFYLDNRAPSTKRKNSLNWFEGFTWYDSANDEEAEFMMKYTPTNLRKDEIESHYDHGFYLSDKLTGKGLSVEEVINIF